MALNSVAVIGAGPAGCAAACGLSSLGVRCILFECGRKGKDKACGDALVPAAIQELGKLGVHEANLMELGAKRFQTVSLHGPVGQPLRVPYGRSELWVVRRATIDQHLRSIVERTCEVCHATFVSAVQPNFGGTELQFRSRSSEVFAGVVIAAGSSSSLSAALTVHGRPRLATAISAYVLGKIPIETLECYFGPCLRPGYGWRFPIGQDCANVGICLASPSPGPKLRDLGDEFVGRLGHGLAEHWRGGLAQLWSGQGTLWYRSEGIVSCGDAAGLVDPSSGEGITAALRSGWEAGRAMGDFVKSGGDCRFLEAYSEWIREYFSAKYARTTAREIWDAWCGLYHQ